jgi:hypothetical protein
VTRAEQLDKAIAEISAKCERALLRLNNSSANFGTWPQRRTLIGWRYSASSPRVETLRRKKLLPPFSPSPRIGRTAQSTDTHDVGALWRRHPRIADGIQVAKTIPSLDEAMRRIRVEFIPNQAADALRPAKVP